MNFLPINSDEMKKSGITQPDFVLVTGDAYVDHPSFGAAIIGRVLEHNGFSVCILPQPNYNELQAFKEFGKPRLAFLVTSGNIDSMVNHYTAAKKKRGKDLYSPNGEAGLRPDRAAIVYSQKIKAAYGGVPIILGGIEASLRRLAHYDYWDDKVRRSILHDSGADIVVYGMGEKTIIEIARMLNAGADIKSVTRVRGTAYKSKHIPDNAIELPSYKEVCASKKVFAESFLIQYKNAEPQTAATLAEHYDDGYVVQNPPQLPLSQSEMDNVYNINYARDYHPSYKEKGGVPAIEEVKFSIISSRGCFGGCNFCALCFHGGRVIQSRSHESIVKEAKLLTTLKGFKGYIHDVGGPTANFRRRACKKQEKDGVCANKKCLFPKACKNLEIDHTDYGLLLKKIRETANIKKVFVRSGIRYDYLIYDKNTDFFKDLCKHHVSGQLKVAPEHVSCNVLEKMGKPPKEVFEKFRNTFYNINEKLGLKQFLVPYLMSGHPGSTLDDAVYLAEYLHKWGYSPEQVQDFYPTPATASTCMYYTEIDPFTKEPVYVCKDPKEKAMQRALIQYKLPANRKLVIEALKKAGREDLIGGGKNCLLRPYGCGVQEKTKKTECKIGASIKKKKKVIRNVHKKKAYKKD